MSQANTAQYATTPNNDGTPLGADYDAFNKGRKEIVFWHPDKVTNGHLAVAGGSGAGKSHLIKKLLNSLPPDVEVELLDWHGDLDLESDEVATCVFSPQTRYGYNPLVINPDPHYGGVEKAITEVIGAMRATSSKLGAKQEFALRNLLLDTYTSWGILPNDPSTWDRRVFTRQTVQNYIAKGDRSYMRLTYPTIEDVHEVGVRRLKALYIGATDDEDGNRVVDTMGDLAKAAQRLANIKRKIGTLTSVTQGDYEVLEKQEGQRDSAVAAAKEAFAKFAEGISSGLEFDQHIKYQSKETLTSVLYRLENLRATGMFDQNPPPFGRARIRRYFLRPLATSPDELAMFIRLRLRSIVREMMQEGITSRVKRIIVLDEAKPFSSDDPENPVNIIATQMRKFGLGLWQASQSLSHFSDDFLNNSGTVILLAVAAPDFDASARALRIDKGLFGFLQPQKTAILRLSKVGETPRTQKLLLGR